MNRHQSWNIILLFVILIFGFTLATFLVPERERSEAENRELAQHPKLTVQSLLNGDFEKDYETYLTDQFVLRDGWIGLKTAVERLLQRQESKDIYFAKDDYLIEKHTGVFTDGQAETNVQLLASFLERCRGQFENGVSVMIVPNAVSVLRGKLPPLASPYDERLYLARIEQAVPEEMWFDVNEVLWPHRNEEIFYRTDHHWTTRAAFCVYQVWAAEKGLHIPSEDEYEIQTVTEEFEGTIQSKLGIRTKKDPIRLYLQREDIFYTVEAEGQEKKYSVYDYSMLGTKDKYGVFFGGNYALTRIRTRADNGRKILLLKDSYANCFAPFLLAEYEEIDLLDIRYYNQKISDLIADGGYTDLLVLYNAAGFAEDVSLSKLAF